MSDLTSISWEDFAKLSLTEKRPYLARTEGDGMPYHTLFAQQFDRELLMRLCALANRIRFINKSKVRVLYRKKGGVAIKLHILEGHKSRQLYTATRQVQRPSVRQALVLQKQWPQYKASRAN